MSEQVNCMHRTGDNLCTLFEPKCICILKGSECEFGGPFPPYNEGAQIPEETQVTKDKHTEISNPVQSDRGLICEEEVYLTVPDEYLEEICLLFEVPKTYRWMSHNPCEPRGMNPPILKIFHLGICPPGFGKHKQDSYKVYAKYHDDNNKQYAMVYFDVVTTPDGKYGCCVDTARIIIE